MVSASATRGCPTHEQLRGLDIGRLDNETVAIEVAAHVDECETCRSAIDRVAVDDELVEALRQPVAAGDANSLEECSELALRLASHDVDDDDPLLRSGLAGVTVTWLGSRDADGDDPLGAPCRFGDYDVAAYIGRGGWGTVYRATHFQFGTVALKILDQDCSQQPQERARFAKEFQLLAKLDHPQVVRALDHGVCDGRLYLAMEHLEGTTFRQLLQDGCQLSVPDICRMVAQAARAVQHLHEHGLVHRDIKPSNLMVTADGRVVLLDLGITRSGEGRSGPSEHFTQTGHVVGTPRYMAPECWRTDADPDVRMDVFSLGCVLEELLESGRLSKTRSSRQLDSMAKRMTSRDPSKRYQSMSEVASALESCVRKRPTAPAGVLRRVTFALAIVVAIAAAFFGGLLRGCGPTATPEKFVAEDQDPGDARATVLPLPRPRGEPYEPEVTVSPPPTSQDDMPVSLLTDHGVPLDETGRLTFLADIPESLGPERKSQSFWVRVPTGDHAVVEVLPLSAGFLPFMHVHWKGKTETSIQPYTDTDGGSGRGGRLVVKCSRIAPNPNNFLRLDVFDGEREVPNLIPSTYSGKILVSVWQPRSLEDTDQDQLGPLATPITVNETPDFQPQPAIDYPGDIDVFSVQTTSKQPLTITIDGNVSQFDPHVRVFRLVPRTQKTAPRGDKTIQELNQRQTAELLARGRKDDPPFVSRVTITPPPNETIYFVVNAYEAKSTGTYAVSISQPY